MYKGEKNNYTWKEVIDEHARLKENETLASEIIADITKVSKAKDILIVCLSIVIVLLLVVNKKMEGK